MALHLLVKRRFPVSKRASFRWCRLESPYRLLVSVYREERRQEQCYQEFRFVRPTMKFNAKHGVQNIHYLDSLFKHWRIDKEGTRGFGKNGGEEKKKNSIQLIRSQPFVSLFTFIVVHSDHLWSTKSWGAWKDITQAWFRFYSWGGADNFYFYFYFYFILFYFIFLRDRYLLPKQKAIETTVQHSEYRMIENRLSGTCIQLKRWGWRDFWTAVWCLWHVNGWNVSTTKPTASCKKAYWPWELNHWLLAFSSLPKYFISFHFIFSLWRRQILDKIAAFVCSLSHFIWIEQLAVF